MKNYTQKLEEANKAFQIEIAELHVLSEKRKELYLEVFQELEKLKDTTRDKLEKEKHKFNLLMSEYKALKRQIEYPTLPEMEQMAHNFKKNIEKDMEENGIPIPTET